MAKRKMVPAEVCFYESPAGGNPLEDWLKKVGKATRARFYTLIRTALKSEGEFQMPWAKLLGGGLWELRQRMGLRIFFYVSGNELRILHAVIKKKQSDQAAVKQAQKRMKDWMER